MLTSVNNAAWFAYFALSGYWSALSRRVGRGAAGRGARRAARPPRPGTGRGQAVLITVWSAAARRDRRRGRRVGLGTLLTAAFAVQVAPSIWSAYRTAHPTGISRGTWLLILGELACWAAYGADESDPRLITLGALGVVASVLMLARTRWPGVWSGGTSGGGGRGGEPVALAQGQGDGAERGGPGTQRAAHHVGGVADHPDRTGVLAG